MNRRASDRSGGESLEVTLARIEENQNFIKEGLFGTGVTPGLKTLVDKHEKVYTVGKYAGLPLLAAYHGAIQWVASKLLKGV